MTDFTTEAGVRIPDRELRDARDQVEDAIGSVEVSVDADTTRGPGGGSAALAGGAGALDELDEQTEVLHDIHDELEAMAVSGTGGGGGGGGLLDGTSGFTLGSLATGGGGTLASVASLLGGASATGAAGVTGLGVGGSLFLADQYAGHTPDEVRDNVSGGMPSMAAHTAGNLADMLGIQIPTPDPADIFPEIEAPDDLWPNLLGGAEDSTSDIPDRFATDPDAWRDEGPAPGYDPGPMTDVESTVPADSDPTPGPGGHARIQSRGQMQMDFSGTAAGYDSGPARVQFGSQAPPADPDSGRGASREPRVDVNVQEITARIEGRTLRDALSQELQTIVPEIEQHVLDEISSDIPGRL